MEPHNLDQHLSQISTVWTVLRQAHDGTADVAQSAMQQLVERYSPAVFRYLCGALRDGEAASEVFQEFALRLVRGDFWRANPERGRFRSFLKTTLYHLVIDYQRRHQRQPLVLGNLSAELIVADLSEAESDQEFRIAWRAELLNRAWQALEKCEKETGKPFHTLLQFRTHHPEKRSPEMADWIGKILNRQVTPEWVRKGLFQARARFASFLLEEVCHSLENPTEEELTQELIELGLLDYCREALNRRI